MKRTGGTTVKATKSTRDGGSTTRRRLAGLKTLAAAPPPPRPALDERLFVERLALLGEESGLPRMAGRILGWLLIADEPRQSFGAIVDALGASKGSVSSMTRMLIQLGFIERGTAPGDRRDFFELCPDVWTRLLRHRVNTIHRLRELAAETLPQLSDSSALKRRRLETMHQLYAFWEEETERTLQRWQATQAERAAQATRAAADTARAARPRAGRG